MDFDGAILIRWGEFERLHKAGAAYPAIVRLAEIDNFLRNQRTQPRLVEKWSSAIGEVELSSEMVSSAMDDAKQSLVKLARMLSVGTTFTYEELLFALTMRVELDLFVQFLARRGIKIDLDVTLADNELLEIARGRENIAAFRSARAAAKRNWGIPVASEWLADTVR